MKIKSHNFEMSGGRTIRDGKSHWPDCITLDIPREEIPHLLATLANAIQYPDKKFQISLMGQLKYNIDEG